MLAEIHGKISSTGSNLSDRLEDQLIGDVFGTLRYIDPRVGLLPFLASSYCLSNDNQQLHPNFSNAQIQQIRFWPWIVEAEPNVLIELSEDSDQGLVILIEAKYYSPLSSDDPPDDALTPDEPSNSELANVYPNENSSPGESQNQLIRQMRGMRAMYRRHRRVQIFLTTDRVYPRDLLSRVRGLADIEGLGDTELYWLCWHDLPAVLQQALQKRDAWSSERDGIILNDLLLLCERKGFGRFSRLAIPGCTAPAAVRPGIGTPPERVPMPVTRTFPGLSMPIPSAVRGAALDVQESGRPL
jgi:hypothetical protein